MMVSDQHMGHNRCNMDATNNSRLCHKVFTLLLPIAEKKTFSVIQIYLYEKDLLIMSYKKGVMQRLEHYS